MRHFFISSVEGWDTEIFTYRSLLHAPQKLEDFVYHFQSDLNFTK